MNWNFDNIGAAVATAILAAFLVVAAAQSQQTPTQQGNQGASAAQQRSDAPPLQREPVTTQPNTSPSPHKPEDKQKIVPHSLLDSALEWVLKFFELKLTDVLIVFFTGVLAVKTAGLFKETAGLRSAADQQALDMKASIIAAQAGAAAAQEAATASSRQAKAAEDALVKLERPYVLPSGIGLIKDRIESGLTVRFRSHIQFKIGNYGRTPALLHNCRGHFLLLNPPLSPTEAFGGNSPPSVSYENVWSTWVLPPNGETIDSPAFELPDHIKVAEDNGWLQPRIPKDHELYFVLELRFEDHLSVMRVARSTWRYSSVDHEFLRHPGKEYNYEREEG